MDVAFSAGPSKFLPCSHKNRKWRTHIHSLIFIQKTKVESTASTLRLILLDGFVACGLFKPFFEHQMS